MTANGKIIKIILLVESILLSIVIGWTLLPSSNIFPPGIYSFWRITIPALVILGCYGQYTRSKKLLFIGIVGCYTFLLLIVTLISFDAETYNFGPTPTIQELAHRVIFVTLVGILLLINFRKIRYRIIHPQLDIQTIEDGNTDKSER